VPEVTLTDRAAELRFSVYGVTFSVQVDRAEILNALSPYLPPGWQPSNEPHVDLSYSLSVVASTLANPPGDIKLIQRDGACLLCATTLDDMLQAFRESLQMNLAVLAKDRVFVHAGAVGWNGQAVVIPAETLHGKSTLVAELVRAGATYFSDEFAVLDAAGCVHPYSCPIALREGSSLVYKRHLSAADLGGHNASQPLRVGLVLLTHYQPGATWRPRRLTPGQAVLALFANTVSARIQPERALQTLKQVVSGATVVRSPRGETSQVVAWLNRKYGEPAEK
jgi:hypothetical protein